MPRSETSLAEKAAWMKERNSEVESRTEPAGTFAERHYTVAEVAAMWNLSHDSARRLFQQEPGVLVLGKSKRGTRRYTTLRIPHSVLERVHRRMQLAA